jgi:hypothetical protein
MIFKSIIHARHIIIIIIQVSYIIYCRKLAAVGAIELCVVIGVITAITIMASYYNTSTGLPQYNNIQQQAANNSKKIGCIQVHVFKLFFTSCSVSEYTVLQMYTAFDLSIDGTCCRRTSVKRVPLLKKLLLKCHLNTVIVIISGFSNYLIFK